MNRRTAFAAILALLASTSGLGAGLDDVRDIDIVRVSAQTKQVHLYLVLDPNQQPEDQATLEKIRRKLDAYRFYVTSGQVWKNEQGNSQLPVVLAVVVTGQMSAATETALTSLKSAYDRLPTIFSYVHMPKPPANRQ